MRKSESCRGDETTLVLCDFDGTLSPLDVGNCVLSRFSVHHEWKRIDGDYKKGFIGSREAYGEVASMLRVTREEMFHYVLGQGGLDPHFTPFYNQCLDQGRDVVIVSDGLDFYIETLLSRHGLGEITSYANRAVFGDDGTVSIEFPYSSEDCGRCGNCKLSILRESRDFYERIIYVGDGQSDLCPAGEADLIFAKGLLYDRFRESDKECVYYTDFSDIEKYLQGE